MYLGNQVTSDAFTSDRTLVLNFLCTQAAISLENARLYQQVQQSLTDWQQTQLTMIQSKKMSALGNLVSGVEDKQIKIEIGDNGHARPESVRDMIFEHLFTTEAVGKGTGLGLTIAKKIIVEAHGGTIEVQSEPEQGTDFCIRLPF